MLACETPQSPIGDGGSLSAIDFTDPDTLSAIQGDPLLSAWFEQLCREEEISQTTGQATGWGRFRPRPDNVELFDQQESFCHDRVPVAVLLKGNASGGTEAAMYKTALFCLRQQPPPRRNTPFWVCSDTYEQTMEACWVEKLWGHGHIPDCEIDWDGISWYDYKRGHPKAVPLKPWPGRPGKNWRLEFRSYDQGRAAFQARSIGGFCFTEQFPHDLFLETLRGCREYMYPGGQFCEFTPIEPELCVWIEHLLDEPPDGWKFYRCNTECNIGNLADGWFDRFVASIPDEMVETRIRGGLATFEGAIYPSFNPLIHVCDPGELLFPPGAFHRRGVDWGASAEHPFACVWGYRDGAGEWWIYDEYLNPDQGSITEDHANEIWRRSLAWGWPKIGVHDLWHGETYADPSRPGDIAEFGRRGIHTVPAANDVYRGIDYVRGLLKMNPASGRVRVHISRNCRWLIEQLRKYRWRRGRKPSEGQYLNPEVGKPVPLKRDDDLPDGFRYMVYTDSLSATEGPTTADYKTDGSRHGVRYVNTLMAKRGRLIASGATRGGVGEGRDARRFDRVGAGAGGNGHNGNGHKHGSR